MREFIRVEMYGGGRLNTQLENLFNDSVWRDEFTTWSENQSNPELATPRNQARWYQMVTQTISRARTNAVRTLRSDTGPLGQEFRQLQAEQTQATSSPGRATQTLNRFDELTEMPN